MAEGKRAIAGRLGLEFLVVVVGILAALGVDDWRQARSDRQLEEHLLISLAADLETDRQDAEIQERLVGRHGDAVNHLLAIAEHPSASLRRQISSYYQTAEQLLSVPLRQVDPRPELQSALAALGVAPGQAGMMPDLAQRLRRDPMIATHALRIRQYYDNRVALEGMKEAREALVESVHRELGLFGGAL